MKNNPIIRGICISAEIKRMKNYGLLRDALYLLNADEQNIIKALYGLDGLIPILLEHYAKSSGMEYSRAEELCRKTFIRFKSVATHIWSSSDY